jgi:acyl dehydratase
MHHFNGLDEVKAAVGQHLGHTAWIDVTQDVINRFADATFDQQWIHVDPERAKAGPFGGTIAHGYWTLSLVPSFLYQLYAVDGVPMQINYGSNRVRYPSTVPVGARVRGGAEFTNFEQGPNHAQLTTTVTVEIEGGPKPACVAEVLTRLG